MSSDIDKLLDKYRKTCFLVASDTSYDKAIKLMALTIINTKSALYNLLIEKLPRKSEKLPQQNELYDARDDGWDDYRTQQLEVLSRLFNIDGRR